MSITRIECTADQLVDIWNEMDREDRDLPFETAASLGLCFRGGFDHAEVKANGWSLKLHDRGMNDCCNDFIFSVPVTERTSRRGPLA